MKKILYLSMILLVGLSGCLKNTSTNFTQSASGSPNTVQFATSTLGQWIDTLRLGFSQTSVVPSATPIPAPIYAELQSSNASLASSAITIAKTPALVAIYNAAKLSNYQLLPDSTYSIVSTTVTTDASGKATFQLSLFSNKIDLTIPYAVGLTISAATGATVSSNRSQVVFAVGVKNNYDGIYNLKGYILRGGDAALTGVVGPKEVTLKTLNGTDVVMVENHGWSATSGVGLASSVQPSYSVNPVTFAVTTFSPGGAFPAGIMAIPGYPGRWNPATKTIYAASTWGGGLGVREMYDTLTYLRPRP